MKCSHGYGARECQNGSAPGSSYCREHAMQSDLFKAANLLRGSLRKQMAKPARERVRRVIDLLVRYTKDMP